MPLSSAPNFNYVQAVTNRVRVCLFLQVMRRATESYNSTKGEVQTLASMNV